MKEKFENLSAEDLIEYLIEKQHQLDKDQIVKILQAWLKLNRFDNFW